MSTTSPSRAVRFFYGKRQIFRRRYGDINILGKTSLQVPARASVWSLNDTSPVHFYIEREPEADGDARYPWNTRTPAVNRLRDTPGAFNIEIPDDHPALQEGENYLRVIIEGLDGTCAEDDMTFLWDPTPIALPLASSDWSTEASVQEIGQAVDGQWEVDRDTATLRSQAPVGHDVLFVVGSLHGSQEATYTVEFDDPISGIFLGLSDFFVTHDAQEPNLGIKPGYSTAGLVTLNPDGKLQGWQSMGDSTYDKPWAWVRRSRFKTIPLSSGVRYRARHQVLFDDGIVLCRFRMWREVEPEPEDWMCRVNTAGVSNGLPRPEAAAFALFQYQGSPTQWSNIHVRSIEDRITKADLAHRPIEDSLYRYEEKARATVRAMLRRLGLR